MTTADPAAAPGAPRSEPVFSTQERRKRELRVVLPRLAVLLVVAGVVHHFAGSSIPAPAWLAVPFLAVVLGIRLRPRRVEVHRDHLALARGSLVERISLLELTGLEARPGAPSGAASWGAVIRVKSLTARLDLADLEDPEGAWSAIARLVLPALAGSYVELLEKGRTLELGAARASGAGLEVAGRRLPWSRLGEVRLEAEGVVLEVVERPDLAVVLPARLLPAAPLVPLVRDGWLPRRPAGEPEAALPEPRPSRRNPALHPELGALRFARYRPGAGVLMKVLGSLGVVAVAAGGAAIGTGVAAPAGLPAPAWLAPGAGLLVLALVAARLLGAPKGSEFAVYEKGLRVAEGAVPWAGARSLTLSRQGAQERIVVAGEHLVATLEVAGAEGRTYARWFEHRLGATLARHDLARIQAGGVVAYSHASVSRSGLVVGDQEVPWEELVGVAVEGGATQVVRRGDRQPLLVVPESAENAAVFTRVVRTWIAEQARSDAETSAVAEAAALAAAAAIPHE